MIYPDNIEDEWQEYIDIIKEKEMNIQKEEVELQQEWDKIMKKYLNNQIESKRKYKKRNE